MGAPQKEDSFDLVIVDMIESYFPELMRDLGQLGHLWIKAQIWQESRFDPLAISPVGAKGLMQIMPGTAAELGISDAFDPMQSIRGGVRYLADQYRHLLEIPDATERMRFSLASYNGGRGYINYALVIARDVEGLPGSFTLWQRAGRPAGKFQRWGTARQFLKDEHCRPQGKQADWRQIFDYVEKIEARYRHYADKVSRP